MGTMPAPGADLGGFRLGEPVHSGGMAVLYRVEGPDEDFRRVMKVPRLGFGEPGSSVISFEVEQTVLSVLHGPHVPRFVAAEAEGDFPYLVMEYVEGRSLTEWVERAPLPSAEVARLGAGLATALHSLHQQEVVHLDVKPANVIIRENGATVLIDYGLAHHAHYPDLLAEEWHRPIGSAPYIAPEQIVGVRCDPRSDLFALGVILYELATGRLPFGAPARPSALRKRLWRDPVPPRAVCPSVPEWLQEIVLRCLEPRAVSRYASAALVGFDLSHPEQVAVTARGRRLRRDGVGKVLRRWFQAAAFDPAPCAQPSEQLSGSPIVLVAVATSNEDDPMARALRDAAARALTLDGQTRLACVSVISPSAEAAASSPEQTSTSRQIKHRSALRHWAEPLGLSPDKVSFHVLESSDAASALLQYAEMNHVAHIVVGAPPRRQLLAGHFTAILTGKRGEGASERLPMLQLMSTVSMRVAAAARCTVTVVRAGSSS